MTTGFDVPAQSEAPPAAPRARATRAVRHRRARTGRVRDTGRAAARRDQPARRGGKFRGAARHADPGRVGTGYPAQGPAHRPAGRVRPRPVGGSHAIAVVCDGVGSLDRSDYAAASVSQRLAQLAMAGVPWPAAFETANAELGKIVAEWEAQQRGGMATTAMALSCDPASRVVARRGGLGG